MRRSALNEYPSVRAATLGELLGIANAVEEQAVRRYAQLAAVMERRGEHETAEAFRRMHREEQAHVDVVAGMAAGHDLPVPSATDFTWQLPPEIAASWSQAASSSLLTPYRAFAIAVRNEEQAFALFSYLAAHAEDPTVAAEAETLAREELAHAALLRKWRRAAYHAEHRRRCAPRTEIGTVQELDQMLAQQEALIAGCHSALAHRLRALGDDLSAALLLSLADDASQPPGAAIPCHEPDCRDEEPLRLLVAAQKPLERLSEELEWILDHADGRLAVAAEAALVRVVGRLARLIAQIQTLSDAPVKARWPSHISR